jgi:lactoylglutathione lyase
MQDETLDAMAASVQPTRNTRTLRIAVASNDRVRIDQHFGHADNFAIHDVTAAGAELFERRDLASHAQGDEDPRETIYRMLADCQVLLVAKIGPVPQEKLASLGIEATHVYAGKSIEDALTEVYAAKTSTAAVDTSGFRMMHAMLRVADLDRSLHFYTELMGMTVLEHREHKKNQFSQVYLGYGDDWSGMTLELVFNWLKEEAYTHGTSFGHIAIEVTDMTALCNKLSAAGVPMPRPPRAQRHGENTVAFVEDPDGHRIELVERPLVAAQ